MAVLPCIGLFSSDWAKISSGLTIPLCCQRQWCGGGTSRRIFWVILLLSTMSSKLSSVIDNFEGVILEVAFTLDEVYIGTGTS